MTNLRKLIKPSELKLARVMFALKTICEKGTDEFNKVAQEYKEAQLSDGIDDPHQALLQLALVNHKTIKVTRYLLASLSELIKAEQDDTESNL